MSGDYNPTAALFPRLVAITSLACLASSFLSQLFSHNQASARQGGSAGSPSWLPALAVQGGYIALIYLAGFSTATLLFLLLAPLQMRYRRWPVTALHAFLLTLVISGSFHWIFHVRLPKGILGIPW